MTTARPVPQPTPAACPLSRGCCSQISSGTCAGCRWSGRACSSLNPSSSSAHSISTGIPTTSSARWSRRPISRACASSRHGAATSADGTASVVGRPAAVAAGDGVVLSAGGHVDEAPPSRPSSNRLGVTSPCAIEDPRPPGRAHQHAVVGRPAQSAAGCTRARRAAE